MEIDPTNPLSGCVFAAPPAPPPFPPKYEGMPRALAIQEGGDHYKGRGIQPVEYILSNKLPFIEGCVIKYVTRWRDKGGVEDLRKARHFLAILIEHEEMTSSSSTP